MLSKLESTIVPTELTQKNIIINFLDEDGQYRQRTYDLFNDEHRAKILKTIEFAMIRKFELRIRNK